MNQPILRFQTPWGEAQCVSTIAQGIVSVSTASHGGLWISAARWIELCDRFPGFVPCAGQPQWLEEDCDCCLAPILWPDEFEPEFLRSAILMVLSGALGPRFASVKSYLHTPAGQLLVNAVREWESINAAKWESGGMHGDSKGWTVFFTRVGDRARQERFFKDYPTKTLWTDAELAAVSTRKPDPTPRVPTARALPVEFNEADCSGVFDGNRVWSETELGGAPGF